MTSQPQRRPAGGRQSFDLLGSLLESSGGAARRTLADPELELLAELLATPPRPAEEALPAPVALRSVAEQREHALRGFLRRTWADSALRYVEWGLLAAALVIFLYWFADGPLRDWLYEWQTPATPAQAAAAPTAAPARQPPDAAPAGQPPAVGAPLPFTTPDMAQERAPDDFIAPGSGRNNAPVIPAAPQPSRLLIPAIGLDTPVKEVFVIDGAWEVADYAAGYMHGTALPGANGNTALAGHAGLRGAVFRDLNKLNPGDDIYLDAGGWRYHYRVRSSTAVWPTQVEVLNPTTTPVLTLLTCTNWDTQRLVVVADLVGSKPLS
jgi:sortase A